jgi:hypothetical protein
MSWGAQSKPVSKVNLTHIRTRNVQKTKTGVMRHPAAIKQGALGDSQERERERNTKRRKKATPTAEAETRQAAKARVRAGKREGGVRALGRRLALK